MSSLEAKVTVLEVELRLVHRELKELKESQKELIEFMHKIQGGKAWLTGMILTASSLGAIITSFGTYLFKH